jgi:hypothetical protein
MEIVQTQIALFFRNQFEGAFEELALKVKNKFIGAQSQYLPIPPNAPPEIPRLMLSSTNMNLNFSKNRVDIFFTTPDGMVNITKDILSIIDQYEIVVDRIGFVQKRFFETTIDTLLALITEERRVATAKELNIKINVSKQIGAYMCNNIESLIFASLTKLEPAGPVSRQGVLIERDINTLNENRLDYRFKADNISEIIDLMKAEADTQILLPQPEVNGD